MYKSAAQPKKKVAMARAKAVRSLYRLVKKPLMLPRTMSVFTVAFTREMNCAGCSSAVAIRVLVCIAGVLLLSPRWHSWVCLTGWRCRLRKGYPGTGADIAPNGIAGPAGGIDGQIGQQRHGGIGAHTIRIAESNCTIHRGGWQFDAHHNPRMPDARILEDYYITWRGDAALSRRSRGLGDLHPSWLPRIARPQVKSIGRKGHRIDLGVGPAHKTHALVGAVGPGKAVWTDLRAILDHGLRESGHAWWVIGAGRFVPSVVAVWITDASPAGGTHVERAGHRLCPGHDLCTHLARWHAGGRISTRRGCRARRGGTSPRCDGLAESRAAPVPTACHPGKCGCNAREHQKHQEGRDDYTTNEHH